MKTIRKTLSLGLLVFFVGLLMTACGSDSSSSSGNNNNNNGITGLPAPTSNGNLPDQTCTNNCGVSKSARIAITNATAFARMVDLAQYENNSVSGVNLIDNNGSWQWGNFFRDLFRNTVNQGGQCLGSYINGRLIHEVTGEDITVQCGGSVTNVVGGENGVSVQSRYNLTITPHSGNIFTGSINLGNGYYYNFELRPNSAKTFWEDPSKNPPFGMNGRFDIYTHLDGIDVKVGYLTN